MHAHLYGGVVQIKITKKDIRSFLSSDKLGIMFDLKKISRWCVAGHSGKFFYSFEFSCFVFHTDVWSPASPTTGKSLPFGSNKYCLTSLKVVVGNKLQYFSY